MGRLVQFVVAHEVGHTLALRHNMKGSSMYPLDSVRSRTWVERMGHSPSIMDYARFNYVAQPEDRLPLETLVPRSARTTSSRSCGATRRSGRRDARRRAADAQPVGGMQDTIPWYRYAGDEGIGGPDPGEASEAVGDADAVARTALGLRTSSASARLIEPATTDSVGATYEDLEEIYNRVVGQWADGARHVARIPGGETSRRRWSASAARLHAAPARPQKGGRGRSSTRTPSSPPPSCSTRASSGRSSRGSIDRVGAAQRRVLNTLLDNSRLQRMIEIEGFATRATGGSRADVYPLGEMLGDLRRGVWSEMYRGQAIDPYRRRLQTTYLDLLATKINPPAPTPPIQVPGLGTISLSGPTAPDARTLLRGELADLERELASAVGRASDRTTRLHCRGRATRSRRSCSPKAPRGAERADPESAEGGPDASRPAPLGPSAPPGAATRRPRRARGRTRRRRRCRRTDDGHAPAAHELGGAVALLQQRGQRGGPGPLGRVVRGREEQPHRAGHLGVVTSTTRSSPGAPARRRARRAPPHRRAAGHPVASTVDTGCDSARPAASDRA
jgi:hypothetical protein